MAVRGVPSRDRGGFSRTFGALLKNDCVEMAIAYQIGDATAPVAQGPKIILHVCSDTGIWGRGFVLALSHRWLEPEKRFRSWHLGEEPLPFALGQVQFVQVRPDIWVANLLAEGERRPADRTSPPHAALREGLKRLADRAKSLGASVHLPRLSVGTIRARWDDIAAILEEELVALGVSVTVYDPPKNVAPVSQSSLLAARRV
jgi:hypothetical protein